MDWSPTVDVILYAVPFFVVFIVLELLSYRYLPDDSPSGGAGRGYETRDTATSLTMGIGSVVINLGWKLVVLAAMNSVRLPFCFTTKPMKPNSKSVLTIRFPIQNASKLPIKRWPTILKLV